MPRKVEVREFPFLEGEHNEVDSRILPDGYVTRCKNLRLRKDGRWGVRADYDAISMTTSTGQTLLPIQIVEYDGRLIALGSSSAVENGTLVRDVYEYVNGDQYAWRASDQDEGQIRMDIIAGVRDLGALPQPAASVANFDCAADDGIVCVVAEVSGTTFIHIFNAATNATLLIAEKTLSKPRVVAAGSVFWICGISGAGTAINRYSFDPANDSSIQTESDAIAAGAAISCWDMARDQLTLGTNGYAVVANRTTPTTTITQFDSTGASSLSYAGAATLFNFVSVLHLTNSTQVVATFNSDSTVRRYAYNQASGALLSGPTQFFVGSTSTKQASVHLGSSSDVTIYMEDSSASTRVVRRALVTQTGSTVHGQDSWVNAYLAAKANSSTNLPGVIDVVGMVIDESGSYSNLLGGFVQQMIGAYKDQFAAGNPTSGHLPKIAQDAVTAHYYWPTLVVDGDGRANPVVSEFDIAAPGAIADSPRQCATMEGLLYIAGGAPAIYDGRQVVEAGFPERPRIVSATASAGAGSLPSSTSLLVAVTWEWRDAQNHFVTSSVSAVSTVTMGGADNTITVVATVPHTLRANVTTDLTGSSVYVVAWRSISGINQLRRAESIVVSTTTFGSTVSITLLASDTTVRTHGVIYTQAGRGVLSGTLPHEAPLPARYLWKFGSRLLTAGVPDARQAQVSKALFPGETANWSGDVAFTIPSIPERIVGVAALDQRGLIFSSERIYQFSGDGPNDNGEGSYSEPVPIPGSTGLMTWQSLVETPIGLFFQGSNGQLWVLPRDGSPPVWIGQPVRDTLVSFPNVTSATLVVKEQLVCFTCNNSGNTDARIVCYDLRAKTWIVDEFATPTPISSACSYNGRLAYLSNGVVYTEKTSLTPNTFIPHGIETGRVKPWGSEWGNFCSEGVTGEARGNCLLQASISFDDGKTYTALHSFSLAALSAGDTVQREWAPLRRKGEHIRMKFDAVTNGVASEGFVFNKWFVSLQKAGGTSRSPGTERG